MKIKKLMFAIVMIMAPIGASAECLGHVHYVDSGVRKTETFEITAMTVDKKTGVLLFAGHGTDPYPPDQIKITGKCKFVPYHGPGDDGVEYFDQTVSD